MTAKPPRRRRTEYRSPSQNPDYEESGAEFFTRRHTAPHKDADLAFYREQQPPHYGSGE